MVAHLVIGGNKHDLRALAELEHKNKLHRRRLAELENTWDRLKFHKLLEVRNDSWLRWRLQSHAALYRDTLEWTAGPKPLVRLGWVLPKRLVRLGWLLT